MRKLFLIGILMLTCLLTYGQKNENSPKEPKGKMVFKQALFDFGNIKQGTVVEHTFNFENTGNAPIIISDVRTTCGCTATKWTRNPIAVGEKASITAQFNSAGKVGIQNKVITIISNASNDQERVTIKANVLTEQ